MRFLPSSKARQAFANFTQRPVSDATVTPTAATVALTGAQRACVLGVLAAPDYRLVPGETRSTPVRVGVVLEF